MKFENQMVKFVLKSVVVLTLLTVAAVAFGEDQEVQIQAGANARAIQQWVAKQRAEEESSAKAETRCESLGGVIKAAVTQSDCIETSDRSEAVKSYLCAAETRLVCTVRR
jgi:hypothetical protein